MRINTATTKGFQWQALLSKASSKAEHYFLLVRITKSSRLGVRLNEFKTCKEMQAPCCCASGAWANAECVGTSNDQVRGDGDAVHLGLHGAGILPSMSQLNVPDHDVPGRVLHYGDRQTEMDQWPIVINTLRLNTLAFTH